MASAELHVPPTNAGLDWPRRVANAVNATLRRVAGAERDIGQIKVDLSDVRGRVATAEDKIATAEGDIDALETAVSRLAHLSVREIADSAAIEARDSILLVDATVQAVTTTLPDSEAGRVIYIKKVDPSANAVTIAAAPGETIDGTATAVLSAQWASFTIAGAPAGWVIL